MPSSSDEQFFQDLVAYDAAYDENWTQDVTDSIPFEASILAKLGFITPSPEVIKIVEQANVSQRCWFSQSQAVLACQKHDQLEVLQQNGYYLVGSDYNSCQLIYPASSLSRSYLQLFVTEMWGQWVEIPESGWEISWELDVVSETTCILHPYIPSLFALMEVDPADEVYVLHEIITEALNLDLLEIPL